jgi:hypothetical protein
MANDVKHVGKMTNTGDKVAVVFRTIPGESNQALVLPTATLPDIYHDSLMKLIETDQAQEAFELGEFMFRNSFPDGRPMLQAMQADDRLVKVDTSNVTMTPSSVSTIPLSELNSLIAEQKGVPVDELHKFVSGAPEAATNPEAEAPAQPVTAAPEVPQAPDNGVLSDEDLAKSYRSQADRLSKEAAQLRRQAEELVPTKKKSKAKVSESA